MFGTRTEARVSEFEWDEGEDKYVCVSACGVTWCGAYVCGRGLCVVCVVRCVCAVTYPLLCSGEALLAEVVVACGALCGALEREQAQRRGAVVALARLGVGRLPPRRWRTVSLWQATAM